MTRKILQSLVLALGAVAWLPTLGWAQVNSGSTGSDGALDFSAITNTTNIVIDMHDHATGIYNYTYAQYSGKRVRVVHSKCEQHAGHLARAKQLCDQRFHYCLGAEYEWWDRGCWCTRWVGRGSGGSNPTGGQGPGGGGPSSTWGGGGSYGSQGSTGQEQGGYPGSIYGNPFLLPLVGGSGGGGAGGGGGGGGGGQSSSPRLPPFR